MADRFFPNDMPDFVAEAPLDDSSPSERTEISLTKLLSLPYKTLSDRLKRSAMDLKKTVLYFLHIYTIQAFTQSNCLAFSTHLAL